MFPAGAFVRNAPSYDKTTANIGSIDMGDIVWKSEVVDAIRLIEHDSGVNVPWILLTSNGGGWVPMESPSGEPVLTEFEKDDK